MEIEQPKKQEKVVLEDVELDDRHAQLFSALDKQISNAGMDVESFEQLIENADIQILEADNALKTSPGSGVLWDQKYEWTQKRAIARELINRHGQDQRLPE